METISISTTQNINLEYELAGIGDRILAVIIDSLIQIGYVIAMIVIASILRGFDIVIGVWFFVLLYLPIFLYEVLQETFFNGQTWGKKARHIRVIHIDGREPTIGQFILRWLLRFVDVSISMGTIAIAAILINGKGQRLGDLAAGTTVIKTRSTKELNQTVFKEIDPDYTITFAQAGQLKTADVETIQSVLNVRSDEPDLQTQLAVKLKAVLEKKLGTESALEPLSFLETVLKDYNAIKGNLA